MEIILHSLKTKMIVLFTLISIVSFSQNGINYQGVARDANDDLMINTDVTLDINILKTSENGAVVYGESHTTTTDVNGVFSIVIGQGVPAAIPYYSVNWAEDKHYLNVSLDGTEVGTTQFFEVPYAYAMGKWQAHKNGVTPKDTGGSIYIGENAGEKDDFTSNNNIGLGDNTLKNNESFQNIAIGNEALMTNTTGWNNLALGPISLTNNTIGNYNIALGVGALFENISGDYNISLGGGSLRDNTIGSRNIALGYSSLSGNINGSNNISFGFGAMNENTSGSYNIASGYKSLYNNTIGINNIALGRDVMHSNTTGGNNIALGYNSLYSNTIGGSNISLGGNSLYSNTSGSNNLALGNNTLSSNSVGNDNIGIGNNTLSSNSFGKENIGIGKDGLLNNTTGDGNIAIGLSTLRDNTSGINNIAMGSKALLELTSGYGNIAYGAYSLRHKLNGNRNIGLGGNTLSKNVNGSDNVAVGSWAGATNLGSSNVFLGTFAGRGAAFDNVSNTLIINSQPWDALTADFEPLIYGEFDNEILGFNAKVGIGTMSPLVPLEIRGGSDASLSDESGVLIIGDFNDNNIVIDNNEIQARNNGAVSDLNLQIEGGDVRVGGAVVHASDRRLKRDIVDLTYGLKDILKLRPTEYFWKGKNQENKSLGLIAQDVEQVIKNVVSYDKEQDKYGVSYTELIPVLIKAIQEQQNTIDTLQKEVNKLKKHLTE